MENITKRSILVPYDFTPHSDFALQHGIQYAKILKTDLLLLHIIPNLETENIMVEKLNSVAQEAAKTAYRLRVAPCRKSIQRRI